MRVVEPGWIVPLLLLTVGLDMLNGVIGLVARSLLKMPGAHPIHYLFGAPSLLDQLIYALVIFPLLDLIVLALTVFLVAVLMPRNQGSLQARARRVLRPYLLALIINGIISALFFQPLSVFGETGLGQNPLVSLMFSCIQLPIYIYLFAVILNALAAGSGRSRWLLFGIYVLAFIIGALVVWNGLGALLALVGIHIPVTL